MTAPTLPKWPVRLVDVPPSGVRIRRKELSEAELQAFAAHIGVNAMTGFTLDLTVKPHRGDGLAVEGRVEAMVTQTCVVTLEPVVNRLDEPIEASFRPEQALKPHLVHDEDEDGPAIDAAIDADDPLIGGAIDAAAIAAEFLALGVDPYPRKEGVAFEAPSEAREASPFAGLSKLKRET
jgi:uncharacterized metal-binding protein YceD (DUF177 family)